VGYGYESRTNLSEIQGTLSCKGDRTMAVEWDATTRTKYKESAQLVIGLVLGAVALLPSIVGLIKAPFVFKVGIFLVLVLAAVSVVLLAVVMILVMIEARSPPVRLVGIGNWFAVAALLVLLVYMLLNVWEDQHSPPTILAMKSSPPAVEGGKYVELDVEVQDQDNDRLSYTWVFEGRELSRRRNAYLKVPDKPGTYVANVSVTDGDHSVEAGQSVEVTAPKKEETVDVSHPSVVQICNAGGSHVKSKNQKQPRNANAGKDKCGGNATR